MKIRHASSNCWGFLSKRKNILAAAARALLRSFHANSDAVSLKGSGEQQVSAVSYD